jgi:Fe-S-cluster-containing dehydrogenase component/formate-dependent nitrite reductase membrane component NrfD
MVRYGFVIDHNRCIGCHACTVACKEEHGVPVGVFRTWVKYIEKGEFPATSRHFGVMRCNHCDNAPCIEICPTQALHYRDNRIVDFDNNRCIGCKSCMQACPYDALYIDPETNTAAKCNFCAHRVELNLEPACVVVCPTQAIIAGDLDDPQSNVSTIIATQKVAARKPHKGTQPKLFYAGIEGDFLQPEMMIPQVSHLFAEHNPAANPHSIDHGGGRPAPGSARVVYDVAHPQPWGSIPSFYLWTKSIAAGVMMIAAVLIALAASYPATASTELLLRVVSPATTLLFVGITALLLIADLKRPDRFYYILIKSNPKSWLVWGTWILMLYGALATAWLGYGLLGFALPPALVICAAIAGVASACYSAFLFAQAKGRDLWQSPLFLWMLAAQAVIAGAAVIILMANATPMVGGQTDPLGRGLTQALDVMLAVGVLLNLLMVLGQVALPSSNADARRAIDAMTHGKLGQIFWYGVVVGGSVVPLMLIGILSESGAAAGMIAAAILALGGIFCFDEVWIKAGQAPPLS